MRHLVVALGLISALASAADASPTRINFTGRLSTKDGPVEGSVNVTFKLFSAATGGTEAWMETQTGIAAEEGLVFAELGAQTPLDTRVFDGKGMFLEITVGGETLAPRLAINSVPYALNATSADAATTLGGTIGAGDVITSVAGANGIVATKSGNMLSVGLSTLGCAAGHALKYNGSSFSCQPDAGTTYTGGTGIAISGTTVSLSTTGCVAGEVWKYNGTAFTCELDANTTYTGTGAIAVSGTQISLSTSGCASGDVWKFSGTSFACVPDANTVYTAGTGISVSGTQISIPSGGVTMSRLNLPSGMTSQTVTLPTSGVISPVSFTPEGSGQCMVTAYLATTESSASGNVDVQVAKGTSLFGPEQALTTASGTSRYSGSATALVSVSAGVTTTFGCDVDISSTTSSFNGNSFTCYISYVCFS